MIKHLRFFMLNLLVLISAAVMAQTTIDFTKQTWSSPFVQSPYTFSAEKNSGSTAQHKTEPLKTSVFMQRTHSPYLQVVRRCAQSFFTFLKKDWLNGQNLHQTTVR